MRILPEDLTQCRVHEVRRRVRAVGAGAIDVVDDGGRLVAIGGRPQLAIARQLQQETLRLRSAVRALHAVSPLATVARGYAILSNGDGVPVQSISQVDTGQRIRARLHDGELALQVDAVLPPATEP